MVAEDRSRGRLIAGLFCWCPGLSQVDFVVSEGGADLFDGGSVGADCFVEKLAGDMELVGPVADV